MKKKKIEVQKILTQKEKDEMMQVAIGLQELANKAYEFMKSNPIHMYEAMGAVQADWAVRDLVNSLKRFEHNDPRDPNRDLP